MSFAITGHKGFHITFQSGVTLSVQFGAANYCDNYDREIGYERAEHRITSTTAELAMWTGEDTWFNFDSGKFEDGSDVKGYCDIAEVEKWIRFAMEYKP